MGQKQNSIFFLTSYIIALAGALPVAAQEAGTEIIFGLSQSFETDDNLDLDPVSAGRTTYAATGLSFGLNRATSVDQFGLDLSTTLRAANGPGVESGFDNQFFGLNYDRLGAQALFGVNASYLQSDIEFLRPLEDFENDAGEIELPPDLDDLNGTGTRERYRAGFSLELGREAPIGATFDADYFGLRYSDTTDPGLSDSDRTTLDSAVLFRLSPRIETSLAANYRLFEADDVEQTRRETRSGFAGLNIELSPIWRLETQLGYTTVDTREFGTTTRSEGPAGFLRLERDMPNGTINATIEQIVTEDGDIKNYLVGRSMNLPTGELAFTVGAADSDLDSTDFIGSLDWIQDLPRGEISARLSRSLDFDEEDGNILRTALFLGYLYDINTVSGISLNAAYTISEEAVRTIDRANFTAAYQHALTEDWALSTGYRYRMREEIAEPRAHSHAVFFSISRDFVTRR